MSNIKSTKTWKIITNKGEVLGTVKHKGFKKEGFVCLENPNLTGKTRTSVAEQLSYAVCYKFKLL